MICPETKYVVILCDYIMAFTSTPCGLVRSELASVLHSVGYLSQAGGGGFTYKLHQKQIDVPATKTADKSRSIRRQIIL